ncbi:MAG: response regulator [Campylobacteraceae bacterium]|nr:response regulator [Campylobacteraceae bacterium]
MKTILDKKILIIDDVSENINVLRHILDTRGYELYMAKDGLKGIEIAKSVKPDLILLDIMMPEIDGYETCKRLKKDKNLKDIPVIFLSALSNIEDKVKAFDVGGIDYIPKPFNEEEVIIRVKAHLQTSMIITSLNNLIEKSFHEIYTPLSVIQTGIEMQILEHGSSEYIESIEAAIINLNVVSDDIYYAIKKEISPFDPKWIELDLFIETQIKYFKPLAKTKNITFTFYNEIENPMIYINDTELKRLLLNVLSNAIKYSSPNTIIEIEIENINNKIVFSIQNQGRIIKEKDKIFKNMFQENSNNLGLGIGLDIVDQICKKNKIKVTVKSINHFTKFSFTYKEEK